MVLSALLLLVAEPVAAPAAAPRASITAVARARIIRPLRIDRRGTAVDEGGGAPRLTHQRTRRDGAAVVDNY
jgi:hypothetical protein